MSTVLRGRVPRSTSRQRVRERAWRLASYVTTPLVPADYLDLVNPLRPGADLRARVLSTRAETRDAVTVVMKPGAAWRGHVPGQYVRIGVNVDGVRHWRSYSLTSMVDDPDGCISVTVKAVPDGVVSGHVASRLRPGQLVHLDQAAGDFRLPEQRPDKVLFVTAGSGITPVMGMLRNSVHELADVVLVHSEATYDDVIFGAELRQLAAAGHLRLVERHTRATGRLDAEALGAVVPDLAERNTWACGPNELLDALEEHWTRIGAADRLRTERFRPSVVTAGDGGTVRFASTGTVVDSDGATSILAAGEAAGVLMPSGCRMGICFGCVVPLREGVVRDLRSGDVTTAAPGDGVLVQTCTSAAAGTCDIDL